MRHHPRRNLLNLLEFSNPDWTVILIIPQMTSKTSNLYPNEQPELRFVPVLTLNARSPSSIENLRFDFLSDFYVKSHLMKPQMEGLIHGLTHNAIADSISTYRAAEDSKNIVSEDALTGTKVFGGSTNSSDQMGSVVSQPRRYKFLDGTRANGNFHGVHSDIKSYLAKPIILQTGSFASTDGPSTFSTFDIFSGLSTPMMYDKIKTIYAITATTVLTLKFNGNAFQQGRYLMAHLPTGGMLQAGSQFNDYVKAHRFSRVQITQLPHVQFDMNADTSAELRIPYQSTLAAMPIYPNFGAAVIGSPGIAFLYPYSPMIATAGSTSIPYTLWVHYEDVVLHGNIVPQSGIRRGTTKGKDLLNSEMKKPGPVESGFSLAADVANAVIGIPILSSIAGPTAWLAAAMSKVAQSFGWSKPTLIDPPSRVFRQFAPYLANSNVKSNAEPLSLHVDNHVGVLPGFAGSDYDELSIDFLKGITAYFADIAWSTVSGPGLLLLNEEITPAMFRTITADGSGNIESMSPIGYFDYQYSYWRGGFNIKLIFVKTHFHSGRLAITFVPNYANIAAPPTTLTNTAYVQREIVDIRLTNEYNLNIPYIAASDWLPCSGSGRLDRSIGYLQIHVVDPLVAPATVPSSISIILEGCGASDLQFAVPSYASIQPVIPLNLQSGIDLNDFYSSNLTSQSGVVTDLGSIGDSSPGNPFLEAYEDTIGEIHLSLRDLLKRGGFINTTNLVTASSTLINPHILMWRRTQAVGLPLGVEEYDPFNTITSFYHSSRGGMRIGIYSNMIASTAEQTIKIYGHTVAATTTSSAITVNAAWTGAQVQWRTTGMGVAITLRSLGGTMVQVPQYLPRPTRLVGNQMSTNITALTYTTGTVTDPNFLILRTESAASTATQVYRAVADDFNLGGFVSIPPMYIVPTP